MAAASTAGKTCRGFSYPVVLGLLLVLSVTASVGVERAALQARREKEAELLFRGQAYVAAIRAYYHAVPGQRKYPASLEDLLRDPRFAHRRYLRKLYQDPMGGQWLFVRGADGGIVGVASASQEVPLKRAFFPAALGHFESAGSYRDWQFVYLPGKSSLGK